MTLRAYQALLIAMFCALLCAPGVTMLVKPEVPKLYGVKEVAYPRFKTLTAWPAEFEAYFAANLGHKRRMVELYNWLGYRVLGDLQSDAVLVGKHDWLYLKQNFGWESMRSEEPLSPSEASGWLSSLDGAERWLARRNVKFLFVIVPSKETIYPEFLPASAPRARSISRLDEVLAVLHGAKAQTLELRSPLLAARAHAQLYDNVDSHWNANGSVVGARLIMERVAALLGRPASFAELDATLRPTESEKDMPLILSLEDSVNVPSVKLEPNHPRAQRLEPPARVKNPTRRQMTRMVFEVDDETLPKALFLRDSFSESFMPTLSEKFRRTVWLWTHELDLRDVEREQPDIVVVEMTERFLSDSPPKLLTRRR